MNIHLLYQYSYFFFTFSKRNKKNKLKKKTIRVHSINPELFPWPWDFSIDWILSLLDFALVAIFMIVQHCARRLVSFFQQLIIWIFLCHVKEKGTWRVGSAKKPITR
jgi:hypothetical protein